MCERAQTLELIGQRDWRRDLQSLDELESSLIAGFRAPGTITIGQVVIFGLEQLDVAGTAGGAAQIPARRQGVDDVGDIAPRLDTSSAMISL